jgi:hypothetical protein
MSFDEVNRLNEKKKEHKGVIRATQIILDHHRDNILKIKRNILFSAENKESYENELIVNTNLFNIAEKVLEHHKNSVIQLTDMIKEKSIKN